MGEMTETDPPFVLSPAQKKLARHAMGLGNGSRRTYRNHFVAGPGHDAFDEWQAMVRIGAARCQNGGQLSGGDMVFWLTRAGGEAALEEGETLKREDFPL